MHPVCRSRPSEVRVHVQSDGVLRCSDETGSSHRLDLMSVWSRSVSMIRDPCRAGMTRVVA